MKNAPRVLMFAFAALLLSSAMYAEAQTAAPVAPPAATIGTAPNGNAIPSTKRNGPCKDDVQNFCSSVPKGHGQVLDCLKANVGKLSPRCEAAMKRHADQKAAPATQAVPAAAPAPSATIPKPSK